MAYEQVTAEILEQYRGIFGQWVKIGHTLDKNHPLKEIQARALKLGAWACPNCLDGWEQYIIATDMHICAVCGYKGGRTKAMEEAE